MTLEMPPFSSTRLEEERAKDKGRVISLRLNEDELAMLRRFMDNMDTENEGRVIKILMRAGAKVIQDHLGDDTLKWLSRRGRARVLGIME